MSKGVIALITGCMLLASNQIVNHFYPIPDFLYGLLIGLSIGLILFGITRFTKKVN